MLIRGILFHPPFFPGVSRSPAHDDHEDPSVLKRLHGTFMVIAWLFFNSLGNTVARYFKKTWTNRQYFGMPLWIFYHRVYMVACWALTCAAIVCIIVDLEAIKAHAHAIVGLTTFVLVFIQPILGLASPGQPQPRAVLRFVHALVGHTAYILAVTNMFLGVGLQEARISSVMYGLLAGALAIHVLAHVVFNVSIPSTEPSRRPTTFVNGYFTLRPQHADIRFSNI
uniref:ascorbate ferrireductase (transmembrane) n=1 Tax=Anopheles atroparvus TaxID=41427 RepID=A0AAG5D5B1_ANOAO